MVGVLSDIGNVRKNNEDYLGYFEDELKRIYVIADGMGGHNAGEVASKLAVETVISYVNSVENYGDMKSILVNAIQFANKKIYELSSKTSSCNGMGTTITCCLVKGTDMIVANVGDSSCYVIDYKNSIKKITKDHSLVQQLIDSGSITEAEARIHPNKNIITRALGTSKDVRVDTFILSINDVRNVILCTDGLTNLLSSDEISKIVCENDSIASCRYLIDSSKKKGGNDNVSVIVFEGVK